MTRYSRNEGCIPAEQQAAMAQSPILIAGCGLGSTIAECVLRLGFERLTVVDGSAVDESELNRHNYLNSDVKKPKAATLAERLKRINPKAEIVAIEESLTEGNLAEVIGLADFAAAVNCLDFASRLPFDFDVACGGAGILVLHPFNFGFGAMLTVVKAGGYQLTELHPEYGDFEMKMADYVSKFGRFWQTPFTWLDDAMAMYRQRMHIAAPPQLSVGSWLLGGMCATALCRIVTGGEVKYFPKFYLSSLDLTAQ